MDGATFRKRFLLSEIAGFGFGMPVAGAYALNMVTLGPGVVGPVIWFTLAVAAVIVIFIALPINLSLAGRHRGHIDRINRHELPREEATSAFVALMALPARHGIYIFARVAGGAIVVGGYMRLWLHVPLLQVTVAVLLAFYGAYMAGLVAYIMVLALLRPVSQQLVGEDLVDREVVRRKRYFSIGLVGKITLFIIIPILVTNLSLFLVLLASTESHLSDSALFVRVLWVIAVNIISLGAGVFLTLRVITRPIAQVQESLNVIASNEGSLSRRLPSDLSDDFAYISFLMNQAIGRFRDIVGKVRTSGELISESSQGLSVSAQEIATTSNEQAAAVKEIVSTMEDSDAVAKAIESRIEEITQIAVDTKQAVDAGFGLVKDSIAKVEEIRQSNERLNDGINFLGERIQSIWEIVNMINTIANRTRIIAFNAELEATAAGEAGRNFQIVATEIRRLADNTTTSTDEIKTRIKEIQDSSDELVESSEQTTQNVVAGHEVSSQLNEVFDHILNSTDTSVSSVQQIRTQIRQQAAAFEQILTTVRQISVGINNFVESTKVTSSSTDALRSMAEELSGIVGRYAV